MKQAMTNYRITSQPWQLKAAAEGTLGAIILPLMPQPKWNEALQYWAWDVLCKPGWTLEWRISVNPEILKFITYQTGDRLYLAEEWCNFPGRLSTGESPYYELRSNYPPLVMPSEKEEWQPAETMPPEAAQYWLKITEVKVTQSKYLDYFTIGKTGFYCSYSESTYPSEEFKNAWDKAHPEHLWSGNLGVIVLVVKNI
jgi:hypothetical protein